MKPFKRFLHASLVILLLAACQPAPSHEMVAFSPPQPWGYADLRALDAADAPHAGRDLLALYVRQVKDSTPSGGALSIRIDLLDLPEANDVDLYLAIDAAPGGAAALPLQAETGLAWDIWIALPANQDTQAFDATLTPLSDASLRVFRDPTLDTVTISFSKALIKRASAPFRLQVFTTAPGQTLLEDSLGPVASDALPPGRALALLAFWNTFPSASPAQALRAWDGAHSGPERSRHGLRYLLAAGRDYRIPIFLLDLKTPGKLAGLDYLGVLPEIQAMTQSGLLHLPDVALVSVPVSAAEGTPVLTIPGWVYARAAVDSRQAGAAFGLPASLLLYTPEDPGLAWSDYGLLITDQNAAQLISPDDGQRRQVIQILSDTEDISSGEVATSSGLSVASRRLLIAAALSPEPDLALVSQDLAQSWWGNPAAAAHSMAWLAGHAWIQLLDEDGLLALRRSTQDGALTPGRKPAADIGATPGYTSQGKPIPSGLTGQQIHALLLTELQHGAGDPVHQAAWQAYLALMGDASAPFELRAAYFGVIGHLLAAAEWMRAPYSSADCANDLDWDGLAECVLASETFFAVLENDGARLSVAFIREWGPGDQAQYHQIIAPTSQAAIGLSDPMGWKLQRGEASDPALTPGAFVDSGAAWDIYTPAVVAGNGAAGNGAITFTSADGERQKTFQLAGNGLRVEYTGFSAAAPMSVRINLGIGFDAPDKPGWSEGFTLLPGNHCIIWGYGTGIKVCSSGQTTLHTFLDTKHWVSQPEDPNLDYPAGHYLPLPLANVEISATGDLWVTIQSTP